MHMNPLKFAAVVVGSWTICAYGAQLVVISVEPVPHSMGAPVDTSIAIHFDRAVDPASVDGRSFWAFGRWSGPAPGSFALSDGGWTVTLDPNGHFSWGETVTVVLSHDLLATDGSTLRDAGYTFQFWTAARQAAMEFETVAVLSTNVRAGESSQPYGGVATDLDGDGWLDISLTNEITEDLRVFMNRADGSGLVNEFNQPTTPLNSHASPSEASDFNRDGHADICVANQLANTVSILLGNGDGTFATPQKIGVGVTPTGLAILDADGDGDIDIVTANFGSGDLSILFNNGQGVFGGLTNFNGGIVGERALSAADMNNDGIFDLVVGGQNSQVVAVNLGNGDGTFSFASSRFVGGNIWMIVLGDVNGDGNVDVTSANAFANSASILFGDGTGQLAPPQTYPVDPFCIATDLGDLDGDGDLDWVTASFNGDWRLFINDGVGGFDFQQEFDAPATASCSLACDLDNDGDLDLALVDETADVLILLKNSGTAVYGDHDGDGDVDLFDAQAFMDCVTGPGGDLRSGCGVFDAFGDSDVDQADFREFQIGFTGAP